MVLTLRPHQVRALEAMDEHRIGQIVVPTGGGKTMIMIQHACGVLDEGNNTIVVVAPRILLAQQLSREFSSFLDDVDIMHVHSGNADHYSSTKSEDVHHWHNPDRKQILFATYHSLHRIIESGIKVDVVYYDEAHNSCARSFYPSVKFYSSLVDVRSYFFTATPKFSTLTKKPGMNDVTVYGDIIENVPAPELIEGGSLIPPTIVPFDMDINVTRGSEHIHDSNAIVKCLKSIEHESPKVVVSIRSSRVLDNMLGRTSLLEDLKELGYDVMHVTSKFGAYVNEKKVHRTTFIKTLNDWGKSGRKFIVLHYSILSEGISVAGLTHCIMLRQLGIIETAQTIGRVIRLNKDDIKDINNGTIQAGNLAMYRKSTGFVCTPAKSIHTVKRIQRVVDDIFVKGIPPLPLAYK